MRTLSHPAPVRMPASDDDWRHVSRCAHASPDDFFPVGHGPAAQRQVARAKQVCAECPVRRPCLAWALDHDVREGVFGGLDEDERRVLARSGHRGG
jgi:WhiB family transcriptional regulator, redox-sensing transcriptional regulator